MSNHCRHERTCPGGGVGVGQRAKRMDRPGMAATCCITCGLSKALHASGMQPTKLCRGDFLSISLSCLSITLRGRAASQQASTSCVVFGVQYVSHSISSLLCSVDLSAAAWHRASTMTESSSTIPDTHAEALFLLKIWDWRPNESPDPQWHYIGCRSTQWHVSPGGRAHAPLGDLSSNSHHWPGAQTHAGLQLSDSG